MAKKSNGPKEPVGRDTAPGLQEQITVPNVNDLASGPWVGTKAEYLSNKESLKAMGYIRPEDEDEGEENEGSGEE